MIRSPSKLFRQPQAQRGFTLVELIITIILIGVLSISAYSRFSGRDDFAAYAYQSQALSLLRNVQTKAMHDSRQGFCYQVNFDTSTSPAFGVPTNNFSAGNQANSCANTIASNLTEGLSTQANELSENELSLSVFDGVTEISYLRFDAMGRPITSVANCTSGCTVNFVGAQSAKVCVEQEGYVHAC